MEPEIKKEGEIKKLINWMGKHTLVSIFVILPGILLMGYAIYFISIFAWINYSEEHQYDKDRERIAKIIPFSQRGEPVPQTDVPVVLPPDPGEAGKQTLAGIDSNNDGVRDDLEREIVYMYPQDEEVRRVLRAMVKKRQDVITTDGDHEYFKELMISAYTLDNCYIFKAFPPNVYDPINNQILLQMLINTSKRKKAQEVNISKATPFSSVAGGSADQCEFMKGQY